MPIGQYEMRDSIKRRMISERWLNSVQIFGCPHYREGGQAGSENKEFESIYMYDDSAKLANMIALISCKTQENNKDGSIYLGGTVAVGGYVLLVITVVQVDEG